MLDLYSGSGLFALPMAQAGARVTAVEENRQAVKDAEANLRLNRIAGGQVRLVCARVEDALPRVAADRWDAVVLDPPRQGCPPAVLAGVFETHRAAAGGLRLLQSRRARAGIAGYPQGRLPGDASSGG